LTSSDFGPPQTSSGYLYYALTTAVAKSFQLEESSAEMGHNRHWCDQLLPRILPETPVFTTLFDGILHWQNVNGGWLQSAASIYTAGGNSNLAVLVGHQKRWLKSCLIAKSTPPP
jgi:hypothetical protein